MTTLYSGYKIMAMAIKATAAMNLKGLMLDAEAHAALMRRMAEDASRLEDELGYLAAAQIDNHGSSPQVSTWIVEQILDTPIKPPAEPKLVGLIEFLSKAGGLRPDLGGELKNLALGKLVSLVGKLSLEDATLDAWHAGYIGHEHGTFGDTRPEQGDLLAALDRERFGDRVLTLADDRTWSDYLAQKEHFERLHKDDPYRMSHFVMRLQARTGGAIKGWRTTKTGHLAITKSSKLRKAEQLAEAFPVVSQYLVKHAQWTKATKLIDSFGPTLRRWQDDDGRCRGQAKVWAAWTGRQSCVDPNLTNQPTEPEFRALWVAPPGRKLAIADYCLTGDTLVVTVDGVRPIVDVVAHPSDVLSVAPGLKLEFRRVERAALIGVVPVVRITFEDGSSVRCTADHEWLARSGEMIKTSALRPGTRLEHVHDGFNGIRRYPTWYVRNQHDYVCKHRLVAAHTLGPCPPDHEVDHIDGNVVDWRAGNLRYLTVSENRGMAAGRWWAKASPEERARKTASLVRGQRENRRSYAGADNPNHGKLKGVAVACPTCKVEFYKPPSMEQIYCSIECRRAGTISECLTCGSEVYGHPSRPRRYCSKECYHGRGKTNHRVVSTNSVGVQPVYHLTVEGNHNFVVGNGLVSSNSQIELRLAAIESGDERLREVYREGRDVHSETASIIHALPLAEITPALRKPAKPTNFLTIYGGGAAKLAETLGCSLERAHEILARFFAAYPGLLAYREEAPARAARDGFISIRPGRRVFYDHAVSSPTQAINAPIQGGAASVQMRALRLAHDALEARSDLDSFLCASVHDEFLIETPADDRAQEAATILIDCMVRALLEIYPEAEDMKMHRLTAASVVDTWSQKS